MKTLAFKADDELHAQLTAIAQLEETTVTELIRTAVVNHLEAKRADGTLAARAQQALDEIDRDAAARRDAISAMLGSTESPAPRGRSRKAPRNTDTATS